MSSVKSFASNKNQKSKNKSKELTLTKSLMWIFGFLVVTGVLAWCTVYFIDNFDENSDPISDGVANYPEHTDYFFINDYSGVFTEETEQYIYNQARKLEQATTAQVVVVAVPDTGLNTLENYSITLANKWKIGTQKEDNGILILFTTKKPRVRIEVGKGLTGVINDAKAGRILDEYVVDYKNAKKWNVAALNAFAETTRILYKYYSIEPPSDLHTFEKAKEFGETDVQAVTMADAKIEPLDYSTLNSFANPSFTFLFIEYYVLEGLILFIILAIIFGDSSGGSSGSSSSSHRSSRSYSSHSSSGSSRSSGGGGSFGGGGASR